MSIVIVGGHDRMVAQYKKICKSYKCKCKVFTQMEADLSKKIGCPDLLVLFTNTVSHKMVKCALDEVKDLYGFETAAIVNMQDVVEHLYNKPCNGEIVIDDKIKAAIDAYYEQYGAK